ncbi:OmpA family protein [Vibrio sp. dsl-7]|uniref:OmpA family protein n=1 Tax=Vibrio chanodichtyis TaxID=3027932 RepID=A0ABT5V1A8_9VIBR|nr:OmpA family protein [Vibrio chanodichtyis]MDE1515441.1 OmpA family protein [Vibrio chanodichtyis]
MKFWICCMTLCLAGCGSLATDRMLSNNLLDVAPQSDADVRHPEWGYATKKSVVALPHNIPQPQPNRYMLIQQYLLTSGIEHEFIAGAHPTIKLKQTVKFATGSAQLSSQSLQWLDRVARFLSTQNGIEVVLEGHADSTGTERFNDTLSQRRANAVKNALIQRQVAQNTIYTRGFGEHVPACSNNTQTGRACNRRVEVRFILAGQ